MKENITITCPKCKGHGRVVLDERLATTFDMVPKKGIVTAKDLFDISIENISVNAWSNRLFELMKMGLLKRQCDGRIWMYFRA